MESEQKKQDKFLVEHCKKLFEASRQKSKHKQLEKAQRYYLNRFEPDVANFSQDENKSYNIINPIIETKTTLVLDSHLTTSVSPIIGSLSNLDNIHAIYKVADAMDDINSHINRINKLDEIGRHSVRDMFKYGICLASVTWDQEASEGLGDVKIHPISPLDFFPDPSGEEIEDMNYITIRRRYSAFTLKRRYPWAIDEIDKLVKSQMDKNSGSTKFEKPGAVVTYYTDEASSQVYTMKGGDLEAIAESIEVFECYLRDDTTFIPKKGDAQSDIDNKIEIGFKYPYGRIVIYAGDSLIFEDKPIETPTGIPIIKKNPYPTGDCWGQGDCEKLFAVQDRINRTYTKIQILVGGFISTIMIDELLGITNEGELVNKLITMVETGNLPTRAPITVTNNTLSEIRNLLDLLARLKEEAKEIARVNDIMISGQSKDTVTSGKMVDALNESPMTSIREVQSVYYSFLVDISNMALITAQTYYQVPRLLRMASGKEFLKIVPPMQDETGVLNEASITRLKADENGVQVIEEIKGDLSLCQFECEIGAGKRLPHSRGAVAQLTLDLYERGIFGAPGTVDSVTVLLDNLDFPNKSAIIKSLKKTNDEMAAAPPPAPPIEKISMAFDQLPIEAQNKLLELNGLPPMDEMESAVKIMQ